MNTTSGAFPLGAAAKQSSPSISQRPRLRRADPWEAAVGSFREVSASARSARFSALCVSRARGEELATLSSTGDGGTGGSSLGLGDDGATAALDGRPVGWLPLRGATSRAGRTGCCAVLRVLVAGERWRGRPGRGWGSVGGLVTSQGHVACLHLPLELVSCPGTRGWAAFCWLDRNFGFWRIFCGRHNLLRALRLVGRVHSRSHQKLSRPRVPPETFESTKQRVPQSPYSRASPLPRCELCAAAARRDMQRCGQNPPFSLRKAPAPCGAAAGGTPQVARPVLPAICRKRDLPRASRGVLDRFGS